MCKFNVIIRFMNLEINFFQILITFLALVFVAAAQTIYLVYSHKKHDERIFTVTREGLNEQSEKIKSIFKKMHLTDKEMTSSLLLLEEIVMRLHGHTEQVVTVRVRNFYGRVSLFLSSIGERYNPLETLKDDNDESEDHLRDLIFKANSMRLSFRRRGKRNVVVIRAAK